MSTKTKQIMTCLLASALALSALAGCSSPSSSSQASGSAAPASTSGASTSAASSQAAAEDDPYADLPKEITAIAFERGQCAASEGSMEDNRWTKWINENSPVKVNWVPIPRTESTTKTNALFASGQAPDLVWEFNKGFMDNLKLQGVIQPVDEYIEKYSTVYKDYLEANAELKPYVTADDGLMYAFTSMRNIENIPNHAMWIRQDWLDNLGLSTPQNTEEFLAAMQAFRDQDPDGNGAADTFGAAFNYNYDGITKALFGQPFGDIILTDGKVSFWSDTEAYADMMSFKKQMYDEKYIDPEYITDTNYTKQRQIWVTGKAGVYFASWDNPNEWLELRQNVPESKMVPYEPFETKYGRFGLFQEPPAEKIICMNKDAKNPKACIEFLDWMLDKGWEAMTFGLEGDHFQLVNGIPQAIDVEKNKTELTYAGEYALIRQYQPTKDWFAVRAAQDPLSQEYAVIKGEANELQLKNKFVRNVPFTMSPTEESKAYSDESGPIIKEIETKIITGGAGYTVEQGIEEINALKERLGWNKIVEQNQAWYDENKDKF